MCGERNKKYKIAYVLTPIDFGGLEKVSLNFLKHVDRDRFEIEPIMFLRPWENGNIFGDEIRRLNFDSFTIPVSNSVKGELFRVPRCLLNLKDIIRKRHYDLVHTHGYLADLLGLPAARASGVPTVSTCHGFISGGLKLSLYNRLDLLALGHFDRVIAVSNSISNDWLVKCVRPERIRVIENATSCPEVRVNTEKYSSSDRENRRNEAGVKSGEVLIGFTGRLSREKGVADLIRAVKILIESGAPVKLLLLGDGGQRLELEELSAGIGVSDKVFFAGFKDDVENWLKAMDIFVLPSLNEGTPMALLEAMAFGLPCIATSVGGIPQVIDSGVDGILVAPGSPNEISYAIYSLCIDIEKRKTISNNAKQKIMLKYNITNWTSKIEREYLNILESENN